MTAVTGVRGDIQWSHDSSSTHVLSLNESPFPPLPEVRHALELSIGRVNRYPDPTCLRLVRELGRFHDVPEDDVIVGPDNLQIAAQLVRAMAAEPGSKIVYATPAFEAYDMISRMVRATPVKVPLTPGSGHDLRAMAAAVDPSVRVVLLSSPHNLTGVPIGTDEVRRFIDGLPAETVVAVDEPCREFVRDPAAADGIDLYREHERVVVLRSFSVAHGLADLRVGYAIAHSPVSDLLHEQIPPFSTSTLGQDAAIASLRNIDRVTERVAILIEERERIWAALTERGFRMPHSEGPYLWLPPEDRCFELAVRCHEVGIAVRLYSNGGLRISVGTPAAHARLIEVASGLRTPPARPAAERTGVSRAG